MRRGRARRLNSTSHKVEAPDHWSTRMLRALQWGFSACSYTHPTFRVRVAECFDPDRRQADQNLTTVRRPRTQASLVFKPAALKPRPPGLITYWASNFRFNQPVACNPYQTSSGTSLPPAFGLRAAEFTWVVPTAKPTSSSGREAKVPVCLKPKAIW